MVGQNTLRHTIEHMHSTSFFIFSSTSVSIRDMNMKKKRQHTRAQHIHVYVWKCILRIFRIIIINDNVFNLHVCLTSVPHIFILIYVNIKKSEMCLCVQVCVLLDTFVCIKDLLPHHPHTSCVYNTQFIQKAHRNKSRPIYVQTSHTETEVPKHKCKTERNKEWKEMKLKQATTKNSGNKTKTNEKSILRSKWY